MHIIIYSAKSDIVENRLISTIIFVRGECTSITQLTEECQPQDEPLCVSDNSRILPAGIVSDLEIIFSTLLHFKNESLTGNT